MSENSADTFPRNPEEAQKPHNIENTEDVRRIQIEEQEHATRFWLESLDTKVERGLMTNEERNKTIARYIVTKDLDREEKYKSARTDKLTGLPNRKAAEEKIEESINSGKKVGILLLDIDHFKDFNTKYGHPGGDETLIQFGIRVQSVIRQRPTDMPQGITENRTNTGGDYLARWGGEEFVVLLESDSLEGVETAGNRILEEIRTIPFTVNDLNGKTHQVPVTASIGGALHESENPEEFIKKADSRLFDAKNSGRNRIVTTNIQPSQNT